VWVGRSVSESEIPGLDNLDQKEYAYAPFFCF
jgi:hypothetical protein